MEKRKKVGTQLQKNACHLWVSWVFGRMGLAVMSLSVFLLIKVSCSDKSFMFKSLVSTNVHAILCASFLLERKSGSFPTNPFTISSIIQKQKQHYRESFSHPDLPSAFWFQMLPYLGNDSWDINFSR
ncbi:hypothetical protein SLA2020_208070 [Shorea laevis]